METNELTAEIIILTLSYSANRCLSERVIQFLEGKDLKAIS
jgi:hypothetical protein